MNNDTNYSRVIAGTMTWGSWGKKLSTRAMVDLMNHCVEIGVSSFDHADIYGGYGNEAEFGKAFTQSGLKRETIQLISKCGIQLVCEARDNIEAHYNYSKDYIIWSAERSLQELKTDYLDLFLLHRPSPLMEPVEITEAINHLVKSGKIRKFGVSNFTPSQIAMLETEISVEANQVEFSLTADEAMFNGTLDDIVANKRMGMAWSPLGSFFREDNEQNGRIRTIMDELGSKYDADASQLLLAWILRHPAGIYPVVGTTDPDRLERSLIASRIEMELEDWFRLHTASMGHNVP